MEILEKYKKAITEEIEPRRKHISDGCCKDIAEYKKLSGEVRGLDLAIMLLEDIENKYIRKEDEDDL